MSQYFQKYHKKSQNIPKKNKSTPIYEWPITWEKIHYKTYPRFEKIKLLSQKNSKTSLLGALKKRKSLREFSSKKMSLNEISYLFSNAVAKFSNSRRPYPSAGARYPVEIYAIIQNCHKLKSGVYHYNVIDNTLELIFESLSPKELEECFIDSWVLDSNLIVLMTGIFDRTVIKYGERGYRFALLEAGHIGQNFILLSSSISLKSIPIGGFFDINIQNLLDLDENKESMIYAIAIGK